MTVIVPLQPPPNLGIPPTDLQSDPNTPRAVLNHSLVVAAVASLPTLSPVLPVLSHEPDYCLAAKRKGPDDDEAVPRATKKAKGDPDAFFGPLTASTIPTPAPHIDASPQQQNVVFDIAIEQALAAAAFLVLPQGEQTEPAATDATSPLPPDQEEPPAKAQPPLASSALLDVFSPNSESQWKPSSVPDVSAFFEAMGQPVAGPSTTPQESTPQSAELLAALVEEKPTARPARIRPPPMLRAIEPPLWKMACRARVDHVIQHYGSSTIRATLAHEAAARRPLSLNGSSAYRSVVEGSSARSRDDLRVEIYTPSSFTPGAASPVDDLDATESEIEEDADMSFDLDWDSESDADEDEDADCDPSTILVDEHESIMDVALDTAARSDTPSRPVLAPSPPPPPETTYTHITPVTISISADLPPLPRLSSIPVGFLREYPDAVTLGTPSRAHPRACGFLSRQSLVAQAQLERESSYYRPMM